jgi:hypothetical protein
MKSIGRALAASVALSVFAIPAAAQEPSTTLPPITVLPPAAVLHSSTGTGAPSGAPSPDVCANAKSGSPLALDCLNDQIKQQVDQINPGLTTPTAPLDARSADTKIGIVNVPAVQQQYGQNFGVSVIPYRPAPLIYASPIWHH